jgi:hypothetical protein
VQPGCHPQLGAAPEAIHLRLEMSGQKGGIDQQQGLVVLMGC